jgi:hypothetical protein
MFTTSASYEQRWEIREGRIFKKIKKKHHPNMTQVRRGKTRGKRRRR